MGSVLKIFSTDTDPVYKDISQNVHFDVVLSVFIHPCKKKSGEELNSVFAQSWRGCLCQWQSQDVFIWGREGPATSLGWHINLHYFNIRL